MSWKSLVSASVLCVVASPVFAAPTLQVTKGGSNASNNLDANGFWRWNVTVTPDLAIVPAGANGTPVATELGFKSTASVGDVAGQGDLINVARLNPNTNFDNLNPGTAIFAWQTGAALLDPTSNNKPTGIQTNCPTGTCSNEQRVFAGSGTGSVLGSANEAFVALGSVDYTTAGAKDLITITTKRPVVTLADPITTNKIQVSGSYTGNGRISQINGGTSPNWTVGNFDTFGGATNSFTRTARGGDTDLDGDNDFNDYLNNLFVNYLQPGTKTWENGDFDGNATVNFDDYLILFTNYLSANYTVGPTTPGAGSGSAVPEPASIALVSLALLGGLGVSRRKR
jgi:hypothetical protein